VLAAIDAARVVDAPLQAGLDFTVRLDKPDFVGRAALLAQRRHRRPAFCCCSRSTIRMR
jgi:glycine cleavage system aminomethyltransferase T